MSGENRQTIQLVDVDGDGSQEAVAFFRDAAAEQPLQIVIFKQDDREAYQVYARIEGIGSEIESIDYLDLCGDTGCDILVSWQVSASVHTLVGYTIAGGEPMEILRSGYGRYLAADLDKDGREELVLAQSENGSPARWRLEYYDGRESHMEMLSAAPLSEGATDICAWSSGSLADETPGLFVTSYFGKDVLITDVLCVDEGGLRNLSLHSGKRSSENTCHYYSGVFPADMNGDGITEVPVSREVPAYGGSTASGGWTGLPIGLTAAATRCLPPATAATAGTWSCPRSGRETSPCAARKALPPGCAASPSPGGWRRRRQIPSPS